jgi:two-component system, sensor histidine kinase
MKQPMPITPFNEKERLQSVLDYGILNTDSQEELDGLTVLASNIFKVPIVLITIIDENRQWFKSNFGLTIKETERSISFCQYTILSRDIFEVEDTLLDDRFRDNPLVTGEPHMRYYCGAPITNERGFGMGSLALIDREPRKLGTEELHTLKLLAQQIMNFFELNMKRKELQLQKDLLEERVRQRTWDLEQKVQELSQRDQTILTINNELSRLIYKASHDLLGPLRTMEGLLNIALSEYNVDTLHHYLKMIHFTEQKLDFALVNLLKIVTIKDASDFCAVEFETVLSNAISKAKKRTGAKPVKVNTDISCSSFHCDPVLLEMVFEELVVNSIQYNQNPTVDIRCRIWCEGASLFCQLSDNGIGIRDDEKGRIFEMFYKNLKSRGSGLGLYIVKAAVEKLRGKIQVESRLNAGATFTIILPFECISV